MGAQENRGWKEYGRQERKGREGEKWEEISSTAEYFTTKKARKQRKQKKGAGAGKGTGGGRLLFKQQVLFVINLYIVAWGMGFYLKYILQSCIVFVSKVF